MFPIWISAIISAICHAGYTYYFVFDLNLKMTGIALGYVITGYLTAIILFICLILNKSFKD